MIVVIPFHKGDASLAAKNLRWWKKLDEKLDYQCLLSYDTETDPTEVKALAQGLFTNVHEFTYNPPPTRKWPNASNWAFQHTAWHLHNTFQSIKSSLKSDCWIWVESDAIAMRRGWLVDIELCHIKGGKPFTGHWNHHSKVWNGVSVYPANLVKSGLMMHGMLCENNPWDVVASHKDNIFQNLNVANHLFQHNWADPATDKAYSFKTSQEAQSVVRSGIALFHRCKDGSLIDCLNGEDFTKSPKLEESYRPKAVKSSKANEFGILIVIPVCKKDINSAMLNMQWCKMLDEKTEAEALISCDVGMAPKLIAELTEEASGFFKRVYHFNYTEPINLKWPHPQNKAFLHTANYVCRHFSKPWFWWEQDAIPLQKGWIAAINAEYITGGKPFMGYNVEGMGHMNGVAVYPPDFPKQVKVPMNVVKAWDVYIRGETIHKTHLVNQMFQHMWALDEDGNHTNGEGNPPTFPTWDAVKNMVDLKRIMFHRCKDGTLTRRLMENYEVKR